MGVAADAAQGGAVEAVRYRRWRIRAAKFGWTRALVVGDSVARAVRAPDSGPPVRW
jgi:hypothetical protein